MLQPSRIATDPGVRDDWGRGFARMSDLMYPHDGCLGGAIWRALTTCSACRTESLSAMACGAAFATAGGVRSRNSGTSKHLLARRITARLCRCGERRSHYVPIENRYNFANLSEVGVAWDIGGSSGKVRANISARRSGELVIPSTTVLKNGDALHLVFTDPRGFVCDEAQIVLGKSGEVPLARFEKSAANLRSRTMRKLQIIGATSDTSLTGRPDNSSAASLAANRFDRAARR